MWIAQNVTYTSGWFVVLPHTTLVIVLRLLQIVRNCYTWTVCASALSVCFAKRFVLHESSIIIITTTVGSSCDAVLGERAAVCKSVHAAWLLLLAFLEKSNFTLKGRGLERGSTLYDLHRKDEKGPLSVRRTGPLSVRGTLELFQRQHRGNFWETGWSSCGLPQVHRYHLEMKCNWKKQPNWQSPNLDNNKYTKYRKHACRMCTLVFCQSENICEWRLMKRFSWPQKIPYS